MSQIKTKLIKQVIGHLQNELSVLIKAANNARLAAVDEQSIAETQYDTLAIEAGYLAEGQTQRVIALQQAISLFQQLVIKPHYTKISLGALVQLAGDQDSDRWYFIGPAAAGFQSKMANKNITLVTPGSPLGRALCGNQQYDQISHNSPVGVTVDEINEIL